MSFVTNKSLKVALEGVKSELDNNLPTKVSLLENDSEYIAKTETYNREQIGWLLDSVNSSINTKADKDELDNKVDKKIGKQLSTEDFTTILKEKLEGLTNYNDSELQSKINQLTERLNTILEDENATNVIDTYQEIENFLQGITNTETLTGLLQDLKDEILSLTAQGGVEFEIVINASHYDNIINTNDGLINTLNAFATTVDVSRTKYKSIANNIKFFRITKSDGSTSTVFNVVFNMPKLTNPVICCYGFNKLNSDLLGIGYATIAYTGENSIKITSIRSTMYIDGYAPTYLEANGTASQFVKGNGSLDSTAYLPTASYTASDVLDKVKSVDGAGSGLDADMLDGKQPDDLNVGSANRLNSKNLADENLNDIKIIGIKYYYGYGNNTCINKPDGVNGFHLIVDGRGGDYYVQTLITESYNITYRRICKNNEWTAWKRMLTEDDIKEITEAAYNALTTKDINTLYCIPE